MNEKYRKVAIIVAIILGAGGVLYVGGLFSQLMTNYQVWMDSGGMWGNALMAAPSWNLFVCILKAFTWNGLKGMALLLAAIGGIYLYVRFHDKFTGTNYDDRGFVVSKTGTYGTASWMTEKELKAVLELSTADKATGMILGERKGHLVCLPEDTRLNRHCAIFGASGTMKSRAVIRNALFSVIRRGESAIISDPKSEMYNDMSELFRQNGYEVKVFNLVDPTHSDSWNCMAGLGSDTLMTQVLANVIIGNTSEGKGDKFWDNGELNLLKALILLVSTSKARTEDQKNLSEVYWTLINNAVAHYERVFWDWVKRYYQNRDLYVQVDLDALNQLKGLEREEKEALGHPGGIAGSNVMVHNSVGEKLILANHGILPELENDCRPFALNKTDALTRAQRKKKLEHQLNDSKKNVKYFWSALTYMLLYSYEDCKEDFIDGTAEIWKDFDIGDPYEMAFAFMYLLDNGSDLPWCYFPCTTINCVSALKLPWTRRAFFPMDDGIFYHKDPITREPLLGPAEGTLPKRIKAPELEDWYELRYFDHEELCPERFNLAQIIYRITGCIMPRELNRYQPALKTLERFGITGKRMTHSLMSCMSLMGESTYRTDSSITPIDYTDEDEDFVDEGEYIEELEEQINALKEELKIEKQQAYESSREARNYQQRYESLAQVTANEAQELHDLRELIFRQQDGSYESLQPSKNISFPYSTDSRIIVFGGHESWAREIRRKLPTVRFIDRSAVPNANMIRKADAIWIQTNAMCHSQYYKVVDEAKKNNIPIRYFSFASPNKCAEQFVQEDKKASK